MAHRFRIVWVALAITIAGSSSLVSYELADFVITVQTTDHGISLTCPEGCSWEALSWEGGPPDLVQFFDEDGMTSPGDLDDNDFLISAQKTGDGVSMTCPKGCAWLETTWTGVTNEHVQHMNETGMTSGTDE
jgi:hypothetical protein